MKTLAFLLFSGKFWPFIVSAGTMLLSIFTYALFFGWRYAAGFVALILVHEMGHFIAARSRNLDVGLPTFIPFIGAWIQLKEQPMNAETEAFVGIAGPILGSAAAFLCYILAHYFDSNLLMALAYAGFLINLFNLIPLSPLDGGRIVAVISTRIWFLGLPMLLGIFLWKPSPLLLIIALLAAPQAWAAFRNRAVLGPTYYRASQTVRYQYAAQYLLLAGLLSVMALDAYEAVGHTRNY